MADEKPKMLVALDEEAIRNFIGDGELDHHRAELALQSALRRRIDNPTVEQEFEAKKRDEGEGLLIRQEDLKTGEVQIGYLGETGDYILICGPDYDLDHVNEFPVSGTAQLTIKRRKD